MRLILKPSPCASPLIPRCGEVRTVVQKGQLMGQTNWTSLGSPGGQSTDTFITPRVVQNADGRLEVLLTGSDGNLWHIWQTTPGKEWSTWASLNKPPNVSMISTPIAARNADGRIEAFCTGADDALWHIWQTTPGGSWGIWFSSGKPSSSVGVVNEGSLCVERNADGRLEAFAKGTDLALWHIWQLTPNGLWSSCTSLGTPVQITCSDDIPPDTTIFNNVCVAQNKDGHLEAFLNSYVDGALWHIWHTWQVTPGGEWGS